MKTNGNDKALESYKIFPYVAWIVTLGFAFFVYNLSLKLERVATDLQAQTKSLEAKINAQSSDTVDYESKQ